MGTVAVRVADAHKSYGRGERVQRVLRGLDLSVDAGELLVVLGPSGCGKSTLLRALAGLEQLDSGSVEWAGEESGQESGQDNERPHIGMVFQQPLLLPWLTVRENVCLGGRYRSNRDRFEESYVDSLLPRFGLAELAESYPDQLSGGQAQRVAIARAVLIRPQLLLLDEPFNALDPVTRRQLQDWLREVVADLRLTVVLVTHDVDEALYLGHRIALLQDAGVVSHTWDNEAATGRRDDPLGNPLRSAILGKYHPDTDDVLEGLEDSVATPAGE